MTAALALASMAASPRVGPTVRWSMTSTGSGSAPPSISSARSLASASVKPPVMLVAAGDAAAAGHGRRRARR